MDLSTDELNEKLLLYFSGYVTENKKRRIEEVLNKRTRHLTVVVEDIYKPHNASAIIRTCDCFGIQDLHIIENKYRYKVNPYVSKGASKWVDIIKYNKRKINNTESCFNNLREKGYKIVATSPEKDDLFIGDLKINEKIALVFGTEYEGLSEYALKNSDYFVKIPLFGFTESFNISVSAAICLYDLVEKLHESEIPWRLSEEDKKIIKLSWFKKVVRKSQILEKEFIRSIESTF